MRTSNSRDIMKANLVRNLAVKEEKNVLKVQEITRIKEGFLEGYDKEFIFCVRL